jgi:hypothetical protein
VKGALGLDFPSLIAKIIGVALLAWTARSMYKHFAQRKTMPVQKDGHRSSLTEQLLNSLLLYLWFAFMLAFSIGMIFNN